VTLESARAIATGPKASRMAAAAVRESLVRRAVPVLMEVSMTDEAYPSSELAWGQLRNL
jgi:hypothetical protein